MAKSRKTREQKIAASQRHQQVSQQVTYSLHNISLSNQTSSQKLPQTKVTAHEYASAYSYATIHTNRDLQKTFFISCTLIGLELLLFFVLHQHILKIPWAVY